MKPKREARRWIKIIHMHVHQALQALPSTKYYLPTECSVLLLCTYDGSHTNYVYSVRTDYKEHGQAQAKEAGRSLYGVRITLRDTDASDATIRGRVT